MMNRLACHSSATATIVKAGEDEHNRPIVIASVQTLAQPHRLQRLGASFDTVIVDEAHHAAAESYRTILAHCGAFTPGGPLTVGFTATPERGDGVGLDGVFQKIVYQRSILDMLAAGYLCDLRAIRVQVQANLGGLHSWGGDFVAEEAATALLDAKAPAHIVAAYRIHATGRKALCFTPTVAVAEAVAEAFRDAGIAAEALDGVTPTLERRAILARFRSGATRVVCNCGVLTEGFDEPAIACVIIARPTRSRPLYVQMIGRGTRLYPGKADCLILDVVGATNRHDLQTAASLFGLPPAAIAHQTVTTALAERDQAPIASDATPSGTLTAKPIDLFRRRLVVWVPTDDGRFVLPLGDGRLVLAPQGSGWDVVCQERGKPPQRLATGLDLGYAQGFAGDTMQRAGAAVLASPTAPWRARPASEKQRAALGRLRVPYRLGLSSGEASDLLAAAFAGRR